MKWIAAIPLFLLYSTTCLQSQTIEERYYDSTEVRSYQKVKVDEQHTMHYAYDREGVEIWKQKDLSGTYSVSTSVEFYDDGGIKRSVSYTNTGGSPQQFLHIIEWDTFGRMTLQETRTNETVDTRIDYRYDENGRVQETIMCAPPPGR